MPITDTAAPQSQTVGQLSPTRFPQANPQVAQVEPNHFPQGESKGALDSVKTAAHQAAQQTVEFAKHIPENVQHGAQTTADFMKHIPEKVNGMHIPENVQHGAQATADFVKQIPEKVRGIHIPEGMQHGAQATLDFVKHIPENLQHGAHVTADFVKQRLPSGSAATGATPATTEERAAIPDKAVTVGPTVSGALPLEDAPFSPETRDYLMNLARSDAEGMHVHEVRGAACQTKVPLHLHQQH